MKARLKEQSENNLCTLESMPDGCFGVVRNRGKVRDCIFACDNVIFKTSSGRYAVDITYGGVYILADNSHVMYVEVELLPSGTQIVIE